MTPIDPLLRDAADLRSMASDPTIRRGIDYFRENRVLDLRWEERRLTALVEGSDPRNPYSVQITAEDGELWVDCTCPFDGEPTCKHGIAALLAYARRQPVAALDVETAADEAIATRAKRGRTQVAVEHQGGDRWFGTWSAHTISKDTMNRRYIVQIRALGERLNYCTCADFRVNRLGTCKHIEAVLHQLRKRAPKRYETMARRGPAQAVVHLAWDVPQSPRVRLRWPTKLSPELSECLNVHFDTEGFLTRGLPVALHDVMKAVRGRTDVQVGEDVIEHGRRLAEEADHAARAQRIRDSIMRLGGHLPGVRARLYPFQVQGVAFLAANGRGLLADDMGLGKTLQAIAAATWLTTHEGVQRTLIVCPASLKHQWAREIARFTGHEAEVVQGNPESRLAQYRRGAVFTIVNYELVLRDAGRIQQILSPDLLVLDEAQRIKNWRTKTAAAIKSLQTRYAFVLTGTPLENRLEDLYSLMQVVDARVLGPLWRYLVDFHVTDERGKVLGYRNLSELRRRLAPVMLRRDRTLVRDQLPDRLELRLDIPLDHRQRQLNDEAVDSAAMIAQRAAKQRRPLTPSEERALLSALQNARMACDAAGLVDKESVGSPKLTELERLLEELCVEGGRKVVVFSQWTRMTEMAQGVATKLGLGTVQLHGGIPTARRGALLDTFHKDPAAQVFLSTDAGGVGLNLQCASAVINLDMPWNPAVLEQRIARVHRLGQTAAVQVILMVAVDGYEGRVASLIANKRVLFHEVMHEDAEAEAVGVSKRTVEALLGSLDDAGDTDTDREPGEPGSDAPGSVEPSPSPLRETDPTPERTLAPMISALQAVFGDRIERILASEGGLVTVLDAVTPEDQAQAAGCADGAAVAVVDRSAAAALVRVGLLAPSGAMYERQAVEPGSALQRTAQRKLRAAEALLGSGCDDEALRMLAASLLAVFGARTDAPCPPPQEAPAWIYGTLMPSGVVDAREAALAGGVLAFSAGAAAPPGFAAAALADVRELVASAGDCIAAAP